MTKAILSALADEIEVALQDIAKKYNVQIKRGNGSYGETNATLKLDINEVKEDGTVLDRDAETFLKMAKFYGLEAEDLNKVFTSNGSQYSIVGLNTRRSKYPISAINLSNGNRYKFTADHIKFALGKEVAR